MAYVAAPTMTSMVAAQPAMTSMYATPGASMYMPAMAGSAAVPTTTAIPASTVVPSSMAVAPAVQRMVSAPVTTGTQRMVSAPVTTAAASYLPPVAQAPSFVPAAGMVTPAAPFAVPAPVSLTAGLATPSKVEAEKAAYDKALAAQLDKQVKAVEEEARLKKAMMEQAVKTQLEQYRLQVDEQFKMACLQVDQEASQVINGLREAAILQQTAMDEKAAVTVADYNKKKAIDDMTVKSYQLQKQWYDGEAQLMQQYQATRQAGLQRGVLT